MSDWADEIASKLLWEFMVDDDLNESEENLAAALRKARADALEEAAKVAWKLRWEYGHDVHNAIRALKDKQP